MKLKIYTAILALGMCATLQAQNDLSYYEAIVLSEKQGVAPARLSELEHEALEHPMSPTPYYALSKAFAETSERVWAVVYGELYCNLTTNAQGFLEVSNVLGTMFEKSLTYKGEGKIEISFMAVAGVGKDSPTVPFEMSFELSTIHGFTDFEKFENISLATIHQVRMNQVRAWQDRDLAEHGLIDWYNQLIAADVFEAYNYWLFQNYRPDEYSAWKSRNHKKLRKFLKWRQSHKIDPSRGSWHRIHKPDNDTQWETMVRDGESLLHEKKPQEAIDQYFDPVIQQFNARKNTKSAQFYCARDSKESLVYLMQTAVMNAKGDAEDIPEYWGNRFAEKKSSSEVLPQFWANAFYLKSYALIELGKVDQARLSLEQAVGLSPCNSMYLAELGHVYQLEKNWKMAMQAYKAAGGEAVLYSHPDGKDYDQARAWRGEGFVLIELGKINEAKALYKKCLELNPDDKRALAELKYIEQLEAKQK